METSKEYHENLAGIIKGAHANLRHKYRTCGGDFEKVWSEHCQDEALLSQYAEAMYHLANDVWTKHPKTRIDWCKETCLKYFYEGGLLKVLDKEKRREEFETGRARLKRTRATNLSGGNDGISTQERKNPGVETITGVPTGPGDCEVGNSGAPCEQETKSLQYSQKNSQEGGKTFKIAQREPHRAMDSCRMTSHEATNDILVQTGDCDGSTGDVDSNSVKTESCSELALEYAHCKQDHTSVRLPFREKIRLLDVGSCYNAFQDFEEFLAIGIDISPAVPAVHCCDFLKMKTDTAAIPSQSAFEELRTNLPGSIDRLPRNAFHVVIFSLLLEYFPSPLQRWRCCEKAHELLMCNGLLVIITPDSHHQNKNALMVKSWKIAIESIGFKRFRYEKEEHLHCMAFRKVMSNLSSRESCTNADRNPNLLYIPQDFTDDAINKVTSQTKGVGDKSCSQETEYDEKLMHGFGDLSQCFDD